MNCYFQGCNEKGITKEHIPPFAFFPEGEKDQLLTVKSCTKHNNVKSTDDLYVLAQICMNASPNNRAREVFLNKIKPQLSFNNDALKTTLSTDAIKNTDGTVKYPVDIERFDRFFSALSCGIIFKVSGTSLPINYKIAHVYCNLGEDQDQHFLELKKALEEHHSKDPEDFMEFGKAKTRNENVYTVKIFGLSDFNSSITIVHLFFGKFKVISMLTKLPQKI